MHKSSLFHAVVFYATGNDSEPNLLNAERRIVSAHPLPFAEAVSYALEVCNRNYAAVSFCAERANHA